MKKNKSQNKNDKDIKGSHLLPAGVKIQHLTDIYDMADSEYADIRKRMRLLDAADRSQLWKAMSAKFPKYQVLPETNHINYIKENLLASIYTVGKYAELMPKAQNEIETCNTLNKILSTLWETIDVAKYQRKAGERAALYNYGVTQVGWNNSIIGGTTNNFYRGDVVLKNIDPLKFMKDPYADTLDNGRFVCLWDDYHISVLFSMPIYKNRLLEIKNTVGKELGSSSESLSNTAINDRATTDKSKNKYHRVICYWLKYTDEENKQHIAEIHMLDNEYVIYVNAKLNPDRFPFAELYCNEPGADILGVSEPAKAFKNYLSYNMISSIIATHAYKAQRPPRFVNIQSGINLRQFAKYGADADKTFPVNGDASQAVHYGRFPDLPVTVETLRQSLEYDIKDKSGITDQYAGTKTNSIQTTGGMDAFVDRVTGRDEVKVQLYEEYTKKLTELIVRYYIKYGDERTYMIKDVTSNKVSAVKTMFKDIPNNIGFSYSINIQSELPRNKMRLAQAANILLEKQAQYQPTPEIITMEEWLLMQDIPFKDLIMSRINIQRNTKATEDVTSILFEFAALIEQGVNPDEALAMVVQSVQDGQSPDGAMQDGNPKGNQANAGSFQQAQAAPQESFAG